MATLAALTTGDAAAPNGFSFAPNGAMEVIASANDTTYAYSGGENTTGTYTQGYLLNDVPLDFSVMSALSFRIRYGASGSQVNTWNSLSVRIVTNTGSTILAAADSAGTFTTAASSITTTTATTTAVINFAYVNTTATKANWNDARVEFRIVYTKNMGGDTIQRRVYAFEVTGTYTQQATPTLPTGLTATAGNAQASLSWTAPSYAGTSAISSYDYQVGAQTSTGAELVIATATSSLVTLATSEPGHSQSFVAPGTTIAAVKLRVSWWGPVSGDLKVAIRTSYNGSDLVTTTVAGSTFPANLSTSLNAPYTIITLPTPLTVTQGATYYLALVWVNNAGGSFLYVGTDDTEPYAGGALHNSSGTILRSDLDCVINPTVVTYGSWTSTGNGTTTSKTVTGLTNGSEYVFKVRAVNASGAGDESAASNAVTPAGAGAITITPANASHAHAATSPTVTPVAGVHSLNPDSATHGHAATSPSVAQVHGLSPNGASHGQVAGTPTLSSTAKTESLTDDFSAGTLNTTKWPNSFGDLTIENGQLKLTPETYAATDYNGIISALGAYDLTDSYLLAKPTPPSRQTTRESVLDFKVDDNNGVWMTLSGNDLYLRRRTAGVNSDTTLTFDPAVHVWWRIREAAGTLYWDTSVDGITWTNRRSVSHSLNLTAGTIEFVAGHYTSDPGTYVNYVDNINVTPSVVTITPANAAHGHSAGTPSLTQAHGLSPSGATHAQAATSPTVAQAHGLSPSGATHAQAATSPTVAQVHALQPDSAVHAQSATAPTVTQSHVLAPTAASHGQAATSPSLAQAHVLGAASAAHGQASGSPTFAQVHELAPASATHAQAATASSLTQAHELAPEGAVQAQAATEPTLAQAHELAPEGAVQAQAATEPTLAQAHELAPEGAVQAQAATEPTFAQVHELAVASAGHSQVASESSLAQQHELDPEDTQHAQTAATSSLVQAHGLAAASTVHAQAVTEPSLVQAHELDPEDVQHSQAASEPTLAQQHELDPDDVAHGQTAASPVIDQAYALAPDNATHGHTADASALTQVHELASAAATHGQAATEPTLDQLHLLEPDDAGHGHSATSPVVSEFGIPVNITPPDLPDEAPEEGVAFVATPGEWSADADTVEGQWESYEVPTLVADDSLHGHGASEPALTQLHALEPEDATHGQSTTEPVLTQLHVLEPDDAEHGQAATAPTVAQQHVLAPADATQVQSATGPALDTTTTLQPASATHGQASTEPSLGQLSALSVHHSAHVHRATSPSFAQVINLQPNDAAHGHTVSSPTFLRIFMLAPNSALHAQLVASPSLVQVYLLAVASAAHAQAASAPLLFRRFGPSPLRTLVVQAERRRLVVEPDDRTLVVSVDGRTELVQAEGRSWVIEVEPRVTTAV